MKRILCTVGVHLWPECHEDHAYGKFRGTHGLLTTAFQSCSRCDKKRIQYAFFDWRSTRMP